MELNEYYSLLQSDEELTKNLTPEVESNLVMGVTYLRDKENDKALNVFETALVSSHKVPAFWIGKSLACTNLSTIEEDKFDAIINSFEQAKKLTEGREDLFNNFLTIILSITIIKYQELLQGQLNTVIETIKEAKEAKKAAAAANGAAVLGAAAAATGKSTTTKVIGAAAAAAGAAAAAKKGADAAKLDTIADGVFKLTIKQLELSCPSAKLLSQISLKSDEKIKVFAENSLMLWRDVSTNIYNEALNQLSDFNTSLIGELSTNINKVEEIASMSNDFVEIDEVRKLADLVGFDNHPTYQKMEQIFKKLKDSVTSDEAKTSHQNIKYLRAAIFIAGAGCIGWYFGDARDETVYLDFLGVALMFAVFFIKSKAMKDSIKEMREFNTFINQNKASSEQIDMKLIGMND